jgi:uncharacterized membrane protein
VSGLVSAILVGAASGGRSQAGLAAAYLTAPTPAGPATRIAVASAAIGELIADKLPSTPSRLAPAGIAPRVALGATSAALLARRRGGHGVPVLVATVVGAGAAIGGAILGAAWREAADNRGIPALPAALVEDVTSYALAFTAAAGA